MTRWTPKRRPAPAPRPAATAIALAVAAAVACGPAPPPEPPASAISPPPLPPPSTRPGEWALEQEITIRHPEGENTFRAVVQKRGDTLVLVILGPAGQRALVVTQRGWDVEHTYFAPMRLPFPPEIMLLDVHRTWLVPRVGPPREGVPTAPCDTPGDDCARVEGTTPWRGERARETWRRRDDGWRLATREVRSVAAGEDVAAVRYGAPGLRPGALADGPPPDEVSFENRRYGYTATIRTIRWTPL